MLVIRWKLSIGYGNKECGMDEKSIDSWGFIVYSINEIYERRLNQ